ncbi:fasciclin domain-containing protein [Mucilaginibacter sp. CSA2-8R]|uniref:fasciclin domain-containing protein n=1 Tax=Mucilaginibacter sp. CSA2-8R TaxID=3141542 RepID=UPI00315C730D
MNIKRPLLVLLLFTVALSACKKQWDDRTAIADQQLDKNLMQQIQQNSNLSTFAGYLTKIGYDKILAASKTYTVWAPDNQALQGIDAATVADTAKLRLFVANHIANQTYLTSSINTSARIRTLNGKNVTFTPTTVEDASITAANQYVANGVLHVINKPLTPKLTIWDFVKSLTTVGTLQKAYLQRQDTTFVDTSKATVSSIDPATGRPILVAGTGVVSQNKYFNRVANLAHEDSLYTYIVLTDDAYNAERNKVSRFFATVTNSTDTTMNILSAFNVLKDVAVRGVVQPADLPAFLTSVNGVRVPINKSAIVQTYQASNGIVYVMNSVNFALADKIPTITIQGEKPSFFQRTDTRGNIAFRTKVDNVGVPFSDLLVSGANLPASYFVAYKLSNLNTCQYRVVWRAINDIAYSDPRPTVQQRLAFGPITPIVSAGTVSLPFTVTFPYTTTSSATLPVNYSEVTLTGATGSNTNINSTGGTLTVAKYGSVNMYLQGANVSTTNLNALTLDYVKLIPIL